ncbi:MAG: hypothetical protein DBW85_00350, partial [Synechococcus sp. MED-G71]
MAPLRRRHWLALAGSGLLAACASSRQRLAVQQGMLPALWQRRLPKSWAVESLDLRQDLPPLRAGID